MNKDYTFGAFDGSAYFSRTLITVPQKYLPLAYLLGLKSLEVTRFSMVSFLPSHRHCASKLTARRVPKPIILSLHDQPGIKFLLKHPVNSVSGD